MERSDKKHVHAHCILESNSSDALLENTLQIPAAHFLEHGVPSGGTRWDDLIVYPVYVGVRQLHPSEISINNYGHPKDALYVSLHAKLC